MNIVSKCRCGASLDVTASDITARFTYIEWLKLHEQCPQKMLSPHIAFKYLLRKAQEK